jgi:putative NADH-flavin reductase
MKMTVFGATGGIGRCVVQQAVAAGHHVTAVVRDPAKLSGLEHRHLEIVAADVMAFATSGSQPEGSRPRDSQGRSSQAELTTTLVGRDAVVSALGPRKNGPITVCSDGARSVIEAMRGTDVRRLVAVSASGRVTDAGDGIVTRMVVKPLLQRLLRDSFADLARMEELIQTSGLEWTVMRPPRLTDKPGTGRYRTAVDRNVRGGLVVSRADVADAILASLADPATIGHTLGLGN